MHAFGGDCDENGQITPPWICTIDSISAALSSCDVINPPLNSLVAAYAAPLCHALSVDVRNLESNMVLQLCFLKILHSDFSSLWESKLMEQAV